MYKVMWWNAAGEGQISESMPKVQAEAFFVSMLPEQEAHLLYVTR
jgi:hypothetical protein